MKKVCTILLASFLFNFSQAQYSSKLTAHAWVDSVFNTLSKEEKLAQLMVIRAHISRSRTAV